MKTELSEVQLRQQAETRDFNAAIMPILAAFIRLNPSFTTATRPTPDEKDIGTYRLELSNGYTGITLGNSWKMPDKWHVNSFLVDNDLSNQTSYDVSRVYPNRSMNVSKAKSPEQIAKDITARVLPDALRLERDMMRKLALAADKHHRMEDYIAAAVRASGPIGLKLDHETKKSIASNGGLYYSYANLEGKHGTEVRIKDGEQGPEYTITCRVYDVHVLTEILNMVEAENVRE